MNEHLRRNLYRAVRAASFVLILKGAVGGSLAMLALLGVAVPFFGIEPNPVSEGSAAALGAIIGMIAAFKA